MASWFANLKIQTKILIMLGVMGALNIASAFYAGYQMRMVDNAETFVIEHVDKANLALARANRSLTLYYAGIYQLSASTTKEGNEDAFSQIKRAMDDFDKYTAEAR